MDAERAARHRGARHLARFGRPASASGCWIFEIGSQIVGDYFIALKGLRGPWHWVILLWLFVPGTLIATAFLLAG